MIESGNISRVKRPRLYWLSSPMGLDPGAIVKETDAYDHIALSGRLEPLSCFLAEDVYWEAGSKDPELRFPTLTRAIPRRRPPPDPARLRGTSPEPIQRWERDGYRYPPYTYAKKYMLETADQGMRPLKAEGRKVLMGFDRGHTTAMLKKSPETPEEVRASGDLRCAALRNSFHVSTVAYILDAVLAQMGLKQEKGLTEICDAHVNRQSGSVVIKLEPEDEDELPLHQLPGELEPMGQVERSDDELSRAGEAFLNEMQEETLFLPDAEQLREDDMRLSARIVAAFIRRQEFRGSDVRLDIGSLYRPDSFLEDPSVRSGGSGTWAKATPLATRSTSMCWS